MSFGMDESILRDALALYVEELSDSLPSKEECASISFSPQFERRMERMIRDHQKFYYFWFNTLGKQVASIALLVVFGMAVATFSVKAWREPVVQFIIELFEKFAAITVVQEDPQPAEFTPVEPAYIPEGYVKVSHNTNDKRNIIHYSGANGEEILYRQKLISTDQGGIDTENAEYRIISINGHQGFLNQKDNHTVIVFVADHYRFSVSGNISEIELLKIAESIPLD